MSDNFKMEIVWRNPKSLTPYVKNAKIHTTEQIDTIAGQISAVGWTQPIVVDKQGIIIAGHGRREAALRLNLQEVPVVVAEHLDEYQAMAARIADNVVAKGDMDQDKLKFDLGSLSLRNFNMSLTGFKPMELKQFKLEEKIFPQIIGEKQVIEESAPPPPPEDQEKHEFAPEGPGQKEEGGSFFMDRNPVIQYNIIFDNEDQQKRWHDFLGMLKSSYPDKNTLAERLDQYIQDNG